MDLPPEERRRVLRCMEAIVAHAETFPEEQSTPMHPCPDSPCPTLAEIVSELSIVVASLGFSLDTTPAHSTDICALRGEYTPVVIDWSLLRWHDHLCPCIPEPTEAALRQFASPDWLARGKVLFQELTVDPTDTLTTSSVDFFEAISDGTVSVWSTYQGYTSLLRTEILETQQLLPAIPDKATVDTNLVEKLEDFVRRYARIGKPFPAAVECVAVGITYTRKAYSELKYKELMRTAAYALAISCQLWDYMRELRHPDYEATQDATAHRWLAEVLAVMRSGDSRDRSAGSLACAWYALKLLLNLDRQTILHIEASVWAANALPVISRGGQLDWLRLQVMHFVLSLPHLLSRANLWASIVSSACSFSLIRGIRNEDLSFEQHSVRLLEALQRQQNLIPQALLPSTISSMGYALGLFALGELHSTIEMDEKAEGMFGIHERAVLSPLAERQKALVEQALLMLQQSLTLCPDNDNIITTGRVKVWMATILAKLGRYGESCQACLQIDRREFEAMDANEMSSLMALHGFSLYRLGLLDQAVEVLGVAVRLAEQRYIEARGRSARAWLMDQYDRVFRRASFAMAKRSQSSGQSSALGYNDAILALEKGRGRELRARIIAQDLELVQTSMDVEGETQLFCDVLANLERSQYTLRPELDDITNAPVPGWPIVYLNPEMPGTAVLVSFAKESGLETRFHCISTYTSANAVHDALQFSDWEMGKYSFSLGILGEIAKRVGSNLARHLYDYLSPLWQEGRNSQVRGFTLIPCGHLAVGLPLAGALWRAGNDDKSLADLCPLRYAPSAFIARYCSQRAEQSAERMIREESPRLLSVDVEGAPDQKDHLKAVRMEQQAVSSFFEGRERRLPGVEATVANLQKHLSDPLHPPTHLLFSGHGKGSVSIRGSSGLLLNDDEDPSQRRVLAASAIPSLVKCDLRCVFLSSCSTAAFHIPSPDEALTVPTAFIIAGAAAVIGCVWRIDDLVSALFSTRFFEFHIEKGNDPATALHETQKWMRKLSKRGFREASAKFGDMLDKWDGRLLYAASSTPLANVLFWAGWIVLGA